jgi:hypothetical protein
MTTPQKSIAGMEVLDAYMIGNVKMGQSVDEPEKLWKPGLHRDCISDISKDSL